MTTELQAAAAELEMKESTGCVYLDLNAYPVEDLKAQLEAERAKSKELEELLNAATDDYSSLHKILSESGVDFSKTLKEIEETSSLLKRRDYDGYKSALFNERAKVKKLREALEFYASDCHYVDSKHSCSGCGWMYDSTIARDFGKHAQKSLAETAGE